MEEPQRLSFLNPIMRYCYFQGKRVSLKYFAFQWLRRRWREHRATLLHHATNIPGLLVSNRVCKVPYIFFLTLVPQYCRGWLVPRSILSQSFPCTFPLSLGLLLGLSPVTGNMGLQLLASSNHAHGFTTRMNFLSHKSVTCPLDEGNLITEPFCYCNRHSVTIVRCTELEKLVSVADLQRHRAVSLSFLNTGDVNSAPFAQVCQFSMPTR